ncbi:MAG: SRPBCC family protein [Prolixibacteraceae bacterium]
MKILKIALYTLLGLVGLLLVTAIFVKKDYRIEREVTISKPRQVVFDYVKLLKNQNNYSKWALVDPVMKKEFRGMDGTVGFVSAWDSQVKDVGKGEQEIIGITEGSRIDYELRFILPMQSKDHAFMTTEAVNEGTTKVIWVFYGKMDYPVNLMLLMMNMDEMLGPDLEQGLSKLKSILEQ